MTKQAHALSAYLGVKMVSTLPIRPRRLSQAEIKRLPIEDQIIYTREHPLSDEEKMEALEREDRDATSDMTGEVDERDLNDNHPPGDWGT